MEHANADPELVAGLFEAALDPSRPMRDMMDELARRLEVDAAYFKLVDRSGDIVLEGVGGGIREGSDRDYLDHYLASDIRVPRVVRAQPGSVFDDRALISRDERRRSAFHNEWLIKYEIGHLLHANISPSADQIAIVTLAQDTGRGEFVTAQQRLFNLYVPFFVRAAHLRVRFAQSEARRQLLAGALDCMQGAALLVDQRGRVHFTNLRGEGLLAECDGAGMSGNQLVLSDRRAGAALQQWLDTSSVPQGGVASAGRAVVTAQRPSGKAAYRIEILPVPRSCATAAGSFGPTSLLLISDPSETAGQRLRSVRTDFDLTPAEAALAVAVADGETLRQCADRRGVSIGTVRSQMKQVLGKTGCRRQADLVRVVGAGDHI